MVLAVVAYKVKLNSKPGNVTVLFKGTASFERQQYFTNNERVRAID